MKKEYNETDVNFKKDIEPNDNQMTTDMEDIKALGKEMEQLSQEADESYTEEKENDKRNE